MEKPESQVLASGAGPDFAALQIWPRRVPSFAFLLTLQPVRVNMHEHVCSVCAPQKRPHHRIKVSAMGLPSCQ